jgi:flagellar basal body P-ring formation protein FlgA
MRRVIFLMMPIFLPIAGMAMADSLVATRTIRAQGIVQAEDVTLVAADIPNALTQVADAVGQEARVAIYAGRPIGVADVGPPALVDRNQIVPLAYQSGTLAILTEGRALTRGGVGDVIRVMNLASRSTVSGRVSATGTVVVGPNS